MEQSFATTGPGRIAYLEGGQGVPILLIHGMPTSSYLWRRVLPLLAPRFRVFAPDLMGFGDSDKPEDADLSIVAQAQYLRVLMDTVAWDSGVVVGHDIGGGIAQLISINDPITVSRLVLIDTIAYDSWPVPEIKRLKDPAWDEIIKSLDLTKGFRKALEQGMYHHERVDDELVSRYVEPFRDLGGRLAYLRCARALRTEDLLSVMENVERLEIPTLIIWGESDSFQRLEFGERLQRRMRKAELVVLPEAGHYTPEDRPEEIADLIEGFVNPDV
ncbi:MAG TPA: alpha/beta fold hydrolase [Actinomycetota bacterium]|nr:alpha/beta fold hydrolase [Actinomycetota bacterium]